MFPSNAWYGNSTVLAAYAQTPSPLFPPTIPGFVQPWFGQESLETTENPGVPTFVWGPAARERRHRLGLREHTPIGAPWLYLLELEKAETIPVAPMRADLLPEPPAPRRTLYFPHHGLAGELAAHRHAAAFSQPSTVTVALTHAQAACPKTCEAYSAVGAHVVDLGPATMPVGSFDPFPLQRILELIRVHQEVRVDEVNAYALFAHSAGARVNSDVSQARLDHLVERELGRSCLMPPQELRAIFDWSTHV